MDEEDQLAFQSDFNIPSQLQIILNAILYLDHNNDHVF